MNPSTALATVLVDELRRAGVRDVVLCPGSRSAPLAYAVEAAERHTSPHGLRLHVRVDERSAGFLALGLAKVSRQPAVVITTSGTAVANLHPAVLEAHHGCVPLVVLSADRPAELRGTGANQTTTQPGIFGGSVRWAGDLPAPEQRTGQHAAWRSTADRAVAAARGSFGMPAGPVHLNVALREPLVPGDGGDAPWPEPLGGRPEDRPWVAVPVDLPDVGAAPVAHMERTLVVVGDLPEPGQDEQAVRWAARHGWPVVAEPFGTARSVRAERSQTTVVPHGPLLLTATDWLDRHLPERVVTVGRVTLARPVAALLRRDDVRVEHVTAIPEWTDPSHAVEVVHPLGALTADDGTWETGGWATAWREAGEALAEAVEANPPASGTGLAAARVVGQALPDYATLFVGSSNAVRDLDLGVAILPEGVRVVANRGLAGIDGCVSTALGVALTAGDAPAYALMGDLTFLHDANGLLIGPDEPRPDLTIVVTNDDGGGIFTLLEPGDLAHADRFERIFGTPTGTDIGALCRAHGIRHTVAAAAEDLAAAVKEPPAGIHVVEVPIDRATHRDAHAALRAFAARTVG